MQASQVPSSRASPKLLQKAMARHGSRWSYEMGRSLWRPFGQRTFVSEQDRQWAFVGDARVTEFSVVGLPLI